MRLSQFLWDDDLAFDLLLAAGGEFEFCRLRLFQHRFCPSLGDILLGLAGRQLWERLFPDYFAMPEPGPVAPSGQRDLQSLANFGQAHIRDAVGLGHSEGRLGPDLFIKDVPVVTNLLPGHLLLLQVHIPSASLKPQAVSRRLPSSVSAEAVIS